MGKRGFRLGPERNGLVPVSGALLPEAAGRVRRLFDAYLTPTTAPAFLTEEELADKNLTKDPRSKDQQRHDILIGVLDAMARSGNTPTIGGAAPTVLVTVRAEDLDSHRGAGYADGVDSPLSPTTVKQLVCAGGIQKITLGSNGRIVKLGSPERCFTAPQRRAITARDGGCLIPGCSIPAGWCEVHHVVPHADSGPTHPDNGVLLCWFHHRTIDTSGWAIRMRAGAPEVQAPPWLDQSRRWRPATKSRTALKTRITDPTRKR